MRWQNYIHQDPGVLCGKPVFIGTRISVEMVLEEMAAGDDVKDVIESYPRLTEQHIRAAKCYSTRI